MAMYCFYSNRVEELFLELKSRVFSTEIHPFYPRFILAPSPLMKMWLMQRFADELGVSAGIEIGYVEDGLKKVEEKLTGLNNQFPTSFKLSFLLENEIEKILIDEKDDPIWAPLVHFLGDREQKKKKRKVALAKELARLFVQYDRFARDVFVEPEKLGWQGVLWSRVIDDHEKVATFQSIDLSLTLFAVSYLSPQQFRFLETISQMIDVTLYHLSPCQMYWGDVLSDREARNYEARCKRRHVKESSLLELEDYLRSRNPMLANFGRLGREMAIALEEKTLYLGETYVVSGDIAKKSPWNVSLSEETRVDQTPGTKLAAIQADFLSLRNPEEEEPIHSFDDKSIQVHAASCAFRQVEILKDLVLERIQKGTSLEEILVMAPEIGNFSPYIVPIFEKANIPFKVMEMQSPKENGLVQAFISLIDLASSRYTASSFLELIEFPEFHKKFGWELDQINLFREWIEKMSIFWGFNRRQRDVLLSKENIKSKMVEKSDLGTWSQGFFRLLRSFATKSELKIDQTKAPFLGEFVHVILSLIEDLKPLADGTKMELSEWRLYLEALANTYLEGDQDLLSSHLKKLEIKELKIDFYSVMIHLKESFSKERIHFRQNELNCIRFCSLLPMRAIPAKVVFLLGMDEGVFPKQERNLSINLLYSLKNIDWFPSQTDYDRTLFLEVLLSVRERLYFLYSSISESDGKEQGPSIVVKEVVSYLNRFYGGCIQIQHPSFAFNKAYFSKKSSLFSFSKEAYFQAKAYYLHEKKEDFKPLKNFLPPTKELLREEEEVSIQKLNLAIKNPLKLYFQETLGIWFKENGQQGIKDEEPFQLEALKAAILKREGVVKPIESLIDEAIRNGEFPYGLFSVHAKEKLLREIEEIEQDLKTIGIQSKRLSTLIFSDDPQEEEGVLALPPIKIGSFKIVGRLNNVSDQGLLSWGSDDKIEIIKSWANFLVFQEAVERYSLPFLPKMLFLKNRSMKEMSWKSPHLESLLTYYKMVKNQASPLFPEWIWDILDQPSQEVKKKIETTLKSDYFYHKEAKWAFQNGEIPDVFSWKDIAENVFSPLKVWR